MRQKLIAVLCCCGLLSACGSDAQPTDELMVSGNPVAATAARSPATSVTPAGTVLPQAAVEAAVVVNGTLAVALVGSPAVVLYDLADLAVAPKSVALPAPAGALSAVDGAVLASVGSARTLVRIDLPGGAATPMPVDGVPAGAARSGDRTLVAVTVDDRRGVAVLDGARQEKFVTGGLMSADQVLATDRGVLVLDRLRNSVFEVNVGDGSVGAGLRAGQGSTNGVVDRYGRALVADTRGGALLAFSLDPLLMRQRYPVPGAPYGIAYDSARDLVWVTLTETNEVVGFAVAGEEPVEKYRFPTVRQPNSVAVDSSGGRVFVASADGGGIQVVRI